MTALRILLLLCLFRQAADAQTLPEPQRYAFEHPQMGTVFRLVFYARSDSQAREAARAVFDMVDSLNASMSDYLPESELNRLCALAGTGKKMTLSRDLWDILNISREYSVKSGGAFDITIGNLSRLWRRGRHLQQIPDSARIRDALALTGYRLIRFYPDSQQVELTKAGMQLDLGGIAQGYAADACLRTLARFGIRSALADAGGDIAAGDPPPGKTGWEVETPAEDGKPATVFVRNCGITSSGAQYRYLEYNGLRYSHIIDPKTGLGLTHRHLVTVQAPSATEADAWATALSVSGKAGMEDCLRRYPYLGVRLTELRL